MFFFFNTPVENSVKRPCKNARCKPGSAFAVLVKLAVKGTTADGLFLASLQTGSHGTQKEKGLTHVTVPASEITAFERALINVRTRWKKSPSAVVPFTAQLHQNCKG